MNEITLENLGGSGLILDTPPYSLPPNGVSNCQNVRFTAGQIRNFPGHVEVLDQTAKIDKPYYMQAFALPDTNSYYWIFFGLDDADPPNTEFALTDGSPKINVTPTGNYVVAAGDQWTGGIYGGIPIVTNGRFNYPLYLNGLPDTPQFEILPYKITPGSPPTIDSTWEDESITANCIRTFKNFIIALDVTKSSERFPYLVKWSDAADPGLIPAWDETDPSLLAGEVPLQEEGGYIIDLVPLRDMGMIYRENAIWSVTLVGGQFIFNFRQAINSVGMLAQNCVTEFRGQHVVLGNGDIVAHNGTSAESIVERRLRKYIFRTMDTDNYASSFVTRNELTNEIWVCYPSEGQVLPNMAAIWNWKENIWTLRELPAATSFMMATVDITSQTLPTVEPWGCLTPEDDTDPDNSCDPNDPSTQVTPIAWDPDPPQPKTWTERDFNAAIRSLISVGESGVYKMDSGVTYGDVTPLCTAERTDLSLAGNDRTTKVRRAYPIMTGSGPVRLYIGSQKAVSGPVSWQGPMSFTPGVQNFVNVRRSGKMMAWRIESDNGAEWAIAGMKWDYTEEGRQ